MVPKIIAQVISGRFGEIIIRQKSGTNLEIGELLIAESPKSDEKILMQVTDIFYGSQISQQNLESISGMSLEEEEPLEFISEELRNYKLAKAKTLLSFNGKNTKSCKSLPAYFSNLREITKEDLIFLGETRNGLILGKLRSGTKPLDINISLDGEKALSHHVLITGTTGKGKSVLMKNIIWNVISTDYAVMLILDPHDEYYGRKTFGMKDHPKRDSVIYYSPRNTPSGQRTLKINLKLLRPDHFDFLDLSSPQRQILYLYYKKHKEDWIRNLMLNDEFVQESRGEINEMSLSVARRRLKILLDLDVEDTRIVCNGTFDLVAGEATISDIVNGLESGKSVIIDTSSFSGNSELLIGSLVTSEILRKYKNYNTAGTIHEKPVVNIVLEEAPRVLGKDILEQGPNIFSTIAREGRKFRIGLTAITQLPSLIPKEILANMNTKIILGTEMNTERQSIIESASQDLSDDSRNIASLDLGEAIVSSSFARFALPIKIPNFDEKEKETKSAKFTSEKPVPKSFTGINILR